MKTKQTADIRAGAAAVADDAHLVERLAQQIYPILAGHPPQVQGAVIGDLAAMWLAGFPAGRRDEILQGWIKLVRELVPEQVRAIAAGEPGTAEPKG